MREVRYEKLYIVGFYLCEMFRIRKFIEIDSRLGVDGVGWTGSRVFV